MWDTLTWRDVRSIEINDELGELRQRTVRLLTVLALIGYLIWHLSSLTALSIHSSGRPDVLRYWLVFPVVVACLGISYGLQLHHWRWATEFFFAASLAAIAATMVGLQTALPTVLYPLLTLSAIVLLQPLAGLTVCLLSIGTLVSLAALGVLPFVRQERLEEVSIACLFTVAVGWVLGRNLVIAVKWAMDSYVHARNNAEEARHHRAELYAALRQLDNAYYRLERANAALELAWRAAETAERSKTEFVTNISHELRTPLNLIVGFSEMILTAPETYGQPLPGTYRGDLNAIYRSAQHLLTLSEDVLDLTRVGMGRLALIREPVELGGIINDSCDIVREYISAKRLRLEIDLADDLPCLTIDRLRVRQVLLNLLTNAARHTLKGTIRVSARREDRFVRIEVSDTGKGIEPADLPRVFQEYYSGSSGGDRHQLELGGIGLGLPLSKRFVELHGGQMSVESTLGVGTSFWFTLPVTSVDVEEERQGYGPLRIPGRTDLSERIVVVVGEDRHAVSFFERHFRGYRVVAARSLAEGIDRAQDVRASAILADHDSAPGTDLPVPLVRLQYPRAGQAAAAMNAITYLVKPVTRTDFRDALSRLISCPRVVLIVDDDPRFVRLLTRFFRWATNGGVEKVLTAQSGREAVDLLRNVDLDLVVLDLELGDMRGEEVRAVLAEDPRHAEVPVIIVSAYTPGEADLTHDRQGSNRIVLERAPGFGLEEGLGIVEAALGAMRPPTWRESDSRENGSRVHEKVVIPRSTSLLP